MSYEKNEINYLIYAGTALLILLLLWNSFYIVSPGEIAVKVNNVTGTTVTSEAGYHLKRPFLDSIFKYNVKTELIGYQAVGASRDLQEVTLELQVNFRPAYEEVNKIHVNIGPKYVTKVIEPALFESAKAAIAQYNAEEMMIQREKLKEMIFEKLKVNLSQYNIFIENISIKDIDFREDFNRAVESKVIEQQKVKAEEYKSQQAEFKKQVIIKEAEGDAERQRLLSKSASKDSIALAWISKWNGDVPSVITGGSNTGMFLDISKISSKE
jgi:regulator of protease activity HflC (stomatin/prohibitin superfamily)